jgi:hypothetical protein
LAEKVQVFCRPNSQFSASVGDKQRRKSKKQESLAQAKDVAEDWYLGLKGKAQVGELKLGKTFRQVATRFINEFEVIARGERSPKYVENHKRRIENHLIPLFGTRLLSKIASGLIRDYQIHRMRTDPGGKPPARNTIHQEMLCIRQMQKTANRRGWLEHVPDMKRPVAGPARLRIGYCSRPRSISNSIQRPASGPVIR